MLAAGVSYPARVLLVSTGRRNAFGVKTGAILTRTGYRPGKTRSAHPSRRLYTRTPS